MHRGARLCWRRNLGGEGQARADGAPNALTVKLGCWASIVNFKTGCRGQTAVRPASPANFFINEIGVGDTSIIREVHYIQLFNVTQPCLGFQMISPPHGAAPFKVYFTADTNRSMHISRVGKFSYHGSSTIGGVGFARLDINGQFLTDTSAKVTFFVHFGSCKRTTMTIKWVPYITPKGK